MNKNFILLLIIGFILQACNSNPLDIDVSGIKTEPLKVLRLEEDLFALNIKNIDRKTIEIKTKYGVYYEHYLMNFLSRNGTQDSLYKSGVLSFVNDRDTRETNAYIKKLYPDEKINAIAGELNDCVRRFHHHFPSKKLPTKFITCMSGWNYSFAYADGALISSLDRYLGDNEKFYQMLAYSQYQIKKMNEAYILPDLMRGWMLTEFDTAAPENILIDHTIFYGKIFYAVNALIPQKHDSLIIGYTAKQLNYCRQFEKNIWGYFAEENRLYENNLKIVKELTNDGPFTGTISKECPPRIAMWVGWQIVKSYMQHHKEMTLEQLMSESNAQKILNMSKYRP